MTEAYFVPRGHHDEWEAFEATAHTVSAWGPDLQHGSPPSALLTRAMERHEHPEGTRIARVAVDLMGAVPLGEVRTRARVARSGRRIQLLEAEMSAAGRVVARASAWRFLQSDTTAAEQAQLPRLDLPTADFDSEFFRRWTSGYIDSLDIRGAADGAVWARPTLPLVPGEELTPLQRTMTIADIANGVGAVLDPHEWRFLNTDLVTHIHRLPVGEWIGVTAGASIGPDGIGTTAGALYDESGPIGRTLQALLIEPA